MHQVCKATAIAFVGLTTGTDAFVTNPTARTNFPSTCSKNNNNSHSISSQSVQQRQHNLLNFGTIHLYNFDEDDAQDNAMGCLKQMAAKLRAEAAALEAEKAKQLADAAEKAFRKFDINSDGEVGLSELKIGLEK